MNQIKMNEINNQLPTWNLSEIYKDIKDPNIQKDIKEIRKLSNDFIAKWKGKITKLSASDFVNCVEKYQAINEAIYKLGTHSSLIFATNMEDPEISRYNSSISDQITEILSSLIFFTLELSKIDEKTIDSWMKENNAKKWLEGGGTRLRRCLSWLEVGQNK